MPGKGNDEPRRLSRVQLGLLLRQWRNQAGYTSKQAAEALEWLQPKMSKLEKGGVRAAAAELDLLIKLYGIPSEDANKIRELGREARKRGVTGRVPDWAQTYVELEQGADEIKFYDGEIVMGLLQTERYAQEVLSTSLVTPLAQVSEVVADRTRRQKRLFSENPPKLWVVLGEAILYRMVGDRSVLCEQLRFLHELAGREHVTLQILPFIAGAHAALGTSFHILEFVDPSASFVYLEGLTDADYLDGPPGTDVYTLAFNKAVAAAANERESRRMLDTRIRELCDHQQE